MTVPKIICRLRQTEQVFRKDDTAAGACLWRQALWDSLADLARKYCLELDGVLASLKIAAWKEEK